MPTPAERAELLRIGALLDHEVADLMHVVRPATYHRWRREQLLALAGYGGVFHMFDGLLTEFGDARVKDTPIAEQAIIGAGIGVANIENAGHRDDITAIVGGRQAHLVANDHSQVMRQLDAAMEAFRHGRHTDFKVQSCTGPGRFAE